MSYQRTSLKTRCAQVFWTAFTLAFALIPMWLMVWVWFGISPRDFWEKFAMLTLTMEVAGAAQVVMLVLWGVCFVSVIWKRSR